MRPETLEESEHAAIMSEHRVSLITHDSETRPDEARTRNTIPFEKKEGEKVLGSIYSSAAGD